MQRNQLVEILRILSCFGIVWFHTGAPGYQIAYAGLSVFIILTMQFEFGQNWNREVAGHKRFFRLLWPWMVWFAFFGIMNALRHKPFVPMDHGLLAGVLYGSVGYLWYLPFMFACVVLIDNLKGHLDQRLSFYAATGLSILVLTLVPVWRPWSLAVGFPVAQYVQAISPILLGVMIGTAPKVRFGYFITGSWIATLGAVGIYWRLTGQFEGVAIPHAIAGILTVLALLMGRRLPPTFNVQLVSDSMLGVFLTQGLWIGVAKPLNHFSALLWPTAAFMIGLLAVSAYRLTLHIDEFKAWLRRTAGRPRKATGTPLP